MSLHRALVRSFRTRALSLCHAQRVAPTASHLSRQLAPFSRAFCSQDFTKLRLPTMEQARTMPTSMAEMSNEGLVILAEQGMNEACFERLVRDVMRVDNLEYMDAKKVADQIRAENRTHVAKYAAMSWVGLLGSSFCLVACVPMVFSKSTAIWFNQRFVTTDVPEPADLETCWEVGAWTWNWMEPALGTGSFMLLCLQMSRAQMVNMNFSPWTDRVKTMRAERLVGLYPQYTEDIVFDFAITSALRAKHHNH